MEIVLNGQRREIGSDTTLEELLEALGLGGKRLAVEVNEKVVPRSLFAERRLSGGDRIEIVHAIGGG
ncbi:MAG: sulfur carrier protein ThiS [Ectothiorhodospiraceae bacterium AqS1]|nr:sulfur carrier protein ThiS [Ectothiorhodospiraceae bacterium AqS1]